MKQVEIMKMLHAVCSTCKKCRRCWCSCLGNTSGISMPTQNQCDPRPQRRTTNF